MQNSQTPVARKDGLVIQEMPDEVLVYDLNTNKAHCLNQTAAFVWKYCDGKNTIEDIGSLMEKELGMPVNADMVWLAVDLLNKESLLEEGLKPKFEGLSRREVIKKVGLAAAVALPVVAMLSFPQVALGVSCPSSVCGAHPACTTGGFLYCCLGTCGNTCAVPGCTQPPPNPPMRSGEITIRKGNK